MEKSKTPTHCEICSKKFDFFLHSHKCKRCQRNVCSSCAKGKRVIIGYVDTIQHRTCDVCEIDIQYQFKIRHTYSLAWNTLSEVGREWINLIPKLKEMKNESSYSDLLLEAQEVSNKEESFLVMQKDIMEGRTDQSNFNFSMHEFLHYVQVGVSTEKCRQNIMNVLKANCMRNPDVGYAQGLNYVVAFLLCFLDEENAFWALSDLIENILPPHFYSKIKKDVSLYGYYSESYAIKKLLPSLLEIRSKEGLNFTESVVDLLLPSLLIPIFVDSLNFHTLFLIWEELLKSRDYLIVEKTALAILKKYRELVLQDDSLTGKQYSNIFCREITGDFIESKVKTMDITSEIMTILKEQYAAMFDDEWERTDYKARKTVTSSKVVHKANIELLQKEYKSLVLARNGKAVISQQDFKTLLQKIDNGNHSNNLSQVDSASLFKLFDMDRNGLINFREFLSCSALLIKGTLEDRIIFCFKYHAKSGNSYLTPEEYIEFLETICIMNLAVSKDDADPFIFNSMAAFKQDMLSVLKKTNKIKYADIQEKIMANNFMHDVSAGIEGKRRRTTAIFSSRRLKDKIKKAADEPKGEDPDTPGLSRNRSSLKRLPTTRRRTTIQSQESETESKDGQDRKLSGSIQEDQLSEYARSESGTREKSKSLRRSKPTDSLQNLRPNISAETLENSSAAMLYDDDENTQPKSSLEGLKKISNKTSLPPQNSKTPSSSTQKVASPLLFFGQHISAPRASDGSAVIKNEAARFSKLANSVSKKPLLQETTPYSSKPTFIIPSRPILPETDDITLFIKEFLQKFEFTTSNAYKSHEKVKMHTSLMRENLICKSLVDIMESDDAETESNKVPLFILETKKSTKINAAVNDVEKKATNPIRINGCEASFHEKEDIIDSQKHLKITKLNEGSSMLLASHTLAMISTQNQQPINQSSSQNLSSETDYQLQDYFFIRSMEKRTSLRSECHEFGRLNSRNKPIQSEVVSEGQLPEDLEVMNSSVIKRYYEVGEKTSIFQASHNVEVQSSKVIPIHSETAAENQSLEASETINSFTIEKYDEIGKKTSIMQTSQDTDILNSSTTPIHSEIAAENQFPEASEAINPSERQTFLLIEQKMSLVQLSHGTIELSKSNKPIKSEVVAETQLSEEIEAASVTIRQTYVDIQNKTSIIKSSHDSDVLSSDKNPIHSEIIAEVQLPEISEVVDLYEKQVYHKMEQKPSLMRTSHNLENITNSNIAIHSETAAEKHPPETLEILILPNVQAYHRMEQKTSLALVFHEDDLLINSNKPIQSEVIAINQLPEDTETADSPAIEIYHKMEQKTSSGLLSHETHRVNNSNSHIHSEIAAEDQHLETPEIKNTSCDRTCHQMEQKMSFTLSPHITDELSKGNKPIHSEMAAESQLSEDLETANLLAIGTYYKVEQRTSQYQKHHIDDKTATRNIAILRSNVAQELQNQIEPSITECFTLIKNVFENKVSHPVRPDILTISSAATQVPIFQNVCSNLEKEVVDPISIEDRAMLKNIEHSLSQTLQPQQLTSVPHCGLAPVDKNVSYLFSREFESAFSPHNQNKLMQMARNLSFSLIEHKIIPTSAFVNIPILQNKAEKLSHEDDESSKTTEIMNLERKTSRIPESQETNIVLNTTKIPVHQNIIGTLAHDMIILINISSKDALMRMMHQTSPLLGPHLNDMTLLPIEVPILINRADHLMNEHLEKVISKNRADINAIEHHLSQALVIQAPDTTLNNNRAPVLANGASCLQHEMIIPEKENAKAQLDRMDSETSQMNKTETSKGSLESHQICYVPPNTPQPVQKGSSLTFSREYCQLGSSEKENYYSIALRNSISLASHAAEIQSDVCEVNTNISSRLEEEDCKSDLTISNVHYNSIELKKNSYRRPMLNSNNAQSSTIHLNNIADISDREELELLRMQCYNLMNITEKRAQSNSPQSLDFPSNSTETPLKLGWLSPIIAENSMRSSIATGTILEDLSRSVSIFIHPQERALAVQTSEFTIPTNSSSILRVEINGADLEAENYDQNTHNNDKFYEHEMNSPSRSTTKDSTNGTTINASLSPSKDEKISRHLMHSQTNEETLEYEQVHVLGNEKKMNDGTADLVGLQEQPSIVSESLGLSTMDQTERTSLSKEPTIPDTANNTMNETETSSLHEEAKEEVHDELNMSGASDASSYTLDELFEMRYRGVTETFDKLRGDSTIMMDTPIITDMSSISRKNMEKMKRFNNSQNPEMTKTCQVCTIF